VVVPKLSAGIPFRERTAKDCENGAILVAGRFLFDSNQSSTMLDGNVIVRPSEIWSHAAAVIDRQQDPHDRLRRNVASRSSGTSRPSSQGSAV
jgi:hypothetical protein